MPFALLWSNPLVRKVTLYGAIAFGVLLMVRWYTNSVAEDARRKGEVDGEKRQLQLDQEDWKKRLESIDQLRVDLDKSTAASAQNRAAIKGALAQGVASIQNQLDGIAPRVDAINPSDYDKRIKELLKELK
jgi:hypothetical protein